MFMAVAAGAQTVALSGSLSATGGSSPVTSSTRTVRGAGTVRFDTVTADSGTPQYSKNGGGFTNITEALTITVADGDTLAVRCALITAGHQAAFNMRNGPSSSSQLIEAVTLTRT